MVKEIKAKVRKFTKWVTEKGPAMQGLKENGMRWRKAKEIMCERGTVKIKDRKDSGML